MKTSDQPGDLRSIGLQQPAVHEEFVPLRWVDTMVRFHNMNV